MFSFLPKIRFTPSILISIHILKNNGNTTDFHFLRWFRDVGLQLMSAFLSFVYVKEARYNSAIFLCYFEL